jgi:hypothetical protein
MLYNNLLNASDLRPRKTTTPLQSNRVKPEFCDPILTFYVHMRRFGSIASIKEKPKRTDSQDGWHLRNVYSTFSGEMDGEDPR